MTVTASATFDVPSHVLFKTFIDQGDLMRMTRSAATSEAKVGGQWTLFGGSVLGKYVTLEEGKKIIQTWRFSNWEAPIESRVEISFESQGPTTTLIQITQSGIPSHDRYGNADQDKLCAAGWEEKYFHGLEKFIGYPRNRD